MAKATEFAFVGVNGKRTRSKTIIKVGWVPPPINWFKLNSDGSSFSNPGLAGGGGGWFEMLVAIGLKAMPEQLEPLQVL